jgi:hypothetical protein
MTTYIDQFPHLSPFIDVGGDKYVMGNTAVRLAFNKYTDYLKSFGKDNTIEYLLRKYLTEERALTNKDIVFDTKEEKAQLMDILKKRQAQLSQSPEFASNQLNKAIFKKSHIGISELLKVIEGSNVLDSKPDGKSEKCKADLVTLEKQQPLGKNKIYQILLQMAWYLSHPNDVALKDIECEWASVVNKLTTLRIPDILTSINSANGVPSAPMNYFKRKDIVNTFEKAASFENALATPDNSGQKDDAALRQKIESLMQVLQMKKYLNKKPIEEVTSENTKHLTNQLINNPMAEPSSQELVNTVVTPNNKKGGKRIRGGNKLTLGKELGAAMNPLFDYFRVAMDPIYSLLESKVGSTTSSLPNLLTLLHICNSIRPSSDPKEIYGIYRITKVDKDAFAFIDNQLKMIIDKINGMEGDAVPLQKQTLEDQLLKLPKVRLTIPGNPSITPTPVDQNKYPVIQFFIVDTNLELKDAFMTKQANTKNSAALKKVFNDNKGTELNNAIEQFFVKGDLYMFCTEKGTTITNLEEIPIRNYEIDYSTIDITKPKITTTKPDNYFNKYISNNTNEPLYMEELVDLTPHVAYTDAALALGIFIKMHALMPGYKSAGAKTALPESSAKEEPVKEEPAKEEPVKEPVKATPGENTEQIKSNQALAINLTKEKTPGE